MLTALVAICTKDRPDELRECLSALARADAEFPVLVLDASNDLASGSVCDELRSSFPSLERVAVPAHLSHQRNLAMLEARRRGSDVLIFVDDDVVVEVGAVLAMVRELDMQPDLAGTGAVVTNEPAVHAVTLKSLFALWSRRPGVVLRSGRNVVGHVIAGPWPRRVDWLSTCAVAFRVSMVSDVSFDERLSGYSYGEDLDFTFRLSRQHPLSITRDACVEHRISARGRPGRRSLATRRIKLLHAWVREMQWAGLRTGWFWWSVVGELVLLSAKGVIDAGSRHEAAGVLRGAVEVLREGSSRTAGAG